MGGCFLCLSKAAASEDAGWDRRGAGVRTEWTALRNSSTLWTIPACVYSGIQVGRGRDLLGTRTGSKSLSESGEAELRDCSFPHPSFHISPLFASQWRHFQVMLEHSGAPANPHLGSHSSKTTREGLQRRLRYVNLTQHLWLQDPSEQAPRVTGTWYSDWTQLHFQSQD